ncbi:hypothetical protein AX774_g2496, partial [Zancudomyces culisetae]
MNCGDAVFCNVSNNPLTVCNCAPFNCDEHLFKISPNPTTRLICPVTSNACDSLPKLVVAAKNTVSIESILPLFAILSNTNTAACRTLGFLSAKHCGLISPTKLDIRGPINLLNVPINPTARDRTCALLLSNPDRLVNSTSGLSASCDAPNSNIACSTQPIPSTNTLGDFCFDSVSITSDITILNPNRSPIANNAFPACTFNFISPSFSAKCGILSPAAPVLNRSLFCAIHSIIEYTPPFTWKLLSVHPGFFENILIISSGSISSVSPFAICSLISVIASNLSFHLLLPSFSCCSL